MKNYKTAKSRQKYLEKRLDKVMYQADKEFLDEILTNSSNLKEILRNVGESYVIQDVRQEDGAIYIRAVSEFGEDDEGCRLLTYLISVDYETEKSKIESVIFSSTDSDLDDDDDYDFIHFLICSFNPETVQLQEWLYDGNGCEIPT